MQAVRDLLANANRKSKQNIEAAPVAT